MRNGIVEWKLSTDCDPVESNIAVLFLNGRFLFNVVIYPGWIIDRESWGDFSFAENVMFSIENNI